MCDRLVEMGWEVMGSRRVSSGFVQSANRGLGSSLEVEDGLWVRFRCREWARLEGKERRRVGSMRLEGEMRMYSSIE